MLYVPLGECTILFVAHNLAISPLIHTKHRLKVDPSLSITILQTQKCDTVTFHYTQLLTYIHGKLRTKFRPACLRIHLFITFSINAVSFVYQCRALTFIESNLKQAKCSIYKLPLNFNIDTASLTCLLTYTLRTNIKTRQQQQHKQQSQQQPNNGANKHTRNKQPQQKQIKTRLSTEKKT